MTIFLEKCFVKKFNFNFYNIDFYIHIDIFFINTYIKEDTIIFQREFLAPQKYFIHIMLYLV